MGLKCLIVLVLFMSPSVFGQYRDCEKILDSTTTYPCDECIRCGGNYCNDVSEIQHCAFRPEDGWCPYNQEKNPELNKTFPLSTEGKHFMSLLVEKRAFVGKTALNSIKFFNIPPVKTRQTPYKKIVNSTQQPSTAVEIQVNITKDNKIQVKMIVGTDFCSPNSTSFEYIYVEVGLNDIKDESVLVKYEVPCACGCTVEVVEKNSPQCSGFGDLSCGVCHCREDRKGTRCEKCRDRGDAPESCISPSKPETPCSGNGRCNDCNQCECFPDLDIEGSQYFKAENFCEDLCSTTSKWDECLKNNDPKDCDNFGTPFMSFINASTKALEETENGRKVWVHCNVTLPDCGAMEYAAMERSGEKYVMILKACDATYLGVAGGPGINISVLGGVLAVVVLMIAAAVGYMVWKGGAAAVPLTSPEYANIDAEDCTGVNPLYKPPTSSFKNPMYGKA